MPPHPRVVLFGDSLVSQSFDVKPGGRTVIGWGGGLQAWYGGRADISSRGFPGYNTEMALSLLPKVFPPAGEQPPRLVILCFGGNDAVLEQVNPAQHVDITHYRRNLLHIIEHIRALTWKSAEPAADEAEVTDAANGNEGIIRRPAIMLVTPSPVDETVAEKINGELARVCSRTSELVNQSVCKRFKNNPHGLADRSMAQTRLYATATLAVAQQAGVGCLNLWGGAVTSRWANATASKTATVAVAPSQDPVRL